MRFLVCVLGVASVIFLFSCRKGQPMSPGDHAASIRGATIHYKVAGSGPVLIVQSPGWGYGSVMYEQTLKPLEKDFTVLYYDTRGSGRSSKTDDVSNINVGSHVDDLEALRSFLDLRTFILMGHSHGGYVAMNYALKYPGHVSHLILVGSVVGVPELQAALKQAKPDAAKAFAAAGGMKTDRDLDRWIADILQHYFHDPGTSGNIRNSDHTPFPSRYFSLSPHPIRSLPSAINFIESRYRRLFSPGNPTR